MAKKSSGKKSPEMAMPMHTHVGMSVEKIKNGYITTKTKSSPQGYKEVKEFSKTAPKMPKV